MSTSHDTNAGRPPYAGTRAPRLVESEPFNTHMARGWGAPDVVVPMTPGAPAAAAEHRRRLELVWADGKDHNHHLNGWLVRSKVGYRIEVVSRPPGSVGFVTLPRRWVVERTFAWLGRYRRHSRDDEWHARTSESMIQVSAIHRMLRLLSPDQSRKRAPFKYRKSKEAIPG